MSISKTTLSAAITRDSLSIRVASSSGNALKNVIRIDDEWFSQTAAATGTSSLVLPVRGGEQGSRRVAHAAGAAVLMGLASDFPSSPTGTSVPVPFSPTIRTVTYSTAGAIALPTTIEAQFIELVTGTAGAMTLADPGSDIEGVELTFMAKDAQAYTLTNTTGFNSGGGGGDVATFGGAIGDNITIKAINRIWNVLTKTNVTIA